MSVTKRDLLLENKALKSANGSISKLTEYISSNLPELSDVSGDSCLVAIRELKKLSELLSMAYFKKELEDADWNKIWKGISPYQKMLKK